MPTGHRDEDGPVDVYRVFDAEGALLYVGMTCNVLKRMQAHARTKDWWPQAETVEAAWYPDSASAFAAEQEAIRMERPLHNKAVEPETPPVLPLVPAGSVWHHRKLGYDIRVLDAHPSQPDTYRCERLVPRTRRLNAPLWKTAALLDRAYQRVA